MKTIKVQIPDRMYQQIETLVHEGWFRDREDIVNVALRKFLEANQPELLEQFFHEDVEWGLSGGNGGRN